MGAGSLVSKGSIDKAVRSDRDWVDEEKRISGGGPDFALVRING